MKKRQKLGQHFLQSEKIAQTIVAAAHPTKNDIVLEIGTGKGILTSLLCAKAKKVISYETDKHLYQNAKTLLKNHNLVLKPGDGFKSRENFTVFVSNLPYSKSRDAVKWLLQKKFSRAVIMIQKEFSDKLQTSSKKERRAITVLAQYALEMITVTKVNKSNFVPQPKVDSVVLKIKRKKQVTKELIHAVSKLFSYRRKTIQNIMKQFGKNIKSTKRLDDLDGDEIVKIAKQIIK